ncbi:hypothetical protein RHO15_07550 [Utexia brackfieldae]|uniref:hypothetical protein n=1 Tax=Utexia brackfieldae TaxID=3074108 RepID=UPI00370D2CA6
MKRLYTNTLYFLIVALLTIYTVASLMNFHVSSVQANFWPEATTKFYKTHDIYRGVITKNIGNA